MPKPKQDWKPRWSTAVIINKVNLFIDEIIYVNLSKTKTNVFISIVLRCYRWKLLRFLFYAIYITSLFKKSWANKNVKNVKRDKNKKREKNYIHGRNVAENVRKYCGRSSINLNSRLVRRLARWVWRAYDWLSRYELTRSSPRRHRQRLRFCWARFCCTYGTTSRRPTHSCSCP